MIAEIHFYHFYHKGQPFMALHGKYVRGDLGSSLFLVFNHAVAKLQ